MGILEKALPFTATEPSFRGGYKMISEIATPLFSIHIFLYVNHFSDALQPTPSKVVSFKKNKSNTLSLSLYL
jgi:hypothetical protein